MNARFRDRMAALALATAVATLAAALIGLGAELAYLAPAAVLALALVLGVYPGERALSLVLARRRRRRRPTSTCSRRESPRSTVPRGGALLGSCLAGRAPPRPVLA